MRFAWEGREIEVLGAHLKSKINFNAPFIPGTEDWKSSFVDEALKARIKLATQAANIPPVFECQVRRGGKPGNPADGRFQRWTRQGAH